jgi:GH24 family phage-related lysozyme (muramidase)
MATPSKKTIAGSAAAMAVAVSLIGGWEGLKLKAYQDIVGVWTVCYGETRGVRPGDTYTKAECDQMLAEGIIDFEREVNRLITYKGDIPIETRIAIVSWAYNVGIGAASKSTLMRKLNAGDLEGACNELLKWNKAGGRVVKGLQNRRIDERQLCLRGVNSLR